MAICEYCGQEMITAKGCAFAKIRLANGKVYERMKVGDEGWVDTGKDAQIVGQCMVDIITLDVILSIVLFVVDSSLDAVARLSI